MCSPPRVLLQHRGDLGNVHADADGRAVFRIEDTQLKVRGKGNEGPSSEIGLLSEAAVTPQRCGM